MKQIAQWLEQRDNFPSVVLLVYPGASSMVQAPFFRLEGFDQTKSASCLGIVLGDELGNGL